MLDKLKEIVMQVCNKVRNYERRNKKVKPEEMELRLFKVKLILLPQEEAERRIFWG